MHIGEACHRHCRLWDDKERLVLHLRNKGRYKDAEKLSDAYRKWIADGYRNPDQEVPLELPQEVLGVVDWQTGRTK